MQARVCVIFGGTDGLGLALATLLRADWQVVVVGRSEVKLAEVAHSLKVLTVQADVAQESAMSQSIIEIMQRLGRIDCAIFCAGVWMQGLTGEYSYDQISQLMAVNVVSPAYLTQKIVPIMQQQGSGMLVYILSKDARCVKKNRSLYHSSKWALDGFVGCLREDLADSPVNVVAIYPGLMQTQLFAKSGVQRDTSSALKPEFVARQISVAIDEHAQGCITELHVDQSHQQAS